MTNAAMPMTEVVAKNISAPAPERVCYEAHWRDRSVYISAPCQSIREWQWHCLASAILLERLEGACVLAETILESSLQFFVSELPDEHQSAVQSNSVSDQDACYLRVLLTCSNDEVEIWLPASAHGNVARHGELIESSNLRWSSVYAPIKIAHIALDEADAARLQQGALMLIPSSWQQRWMCTVDMPQFERSVAATINPINGTIDLDYTNSAEHIWTGSTSGQSVVTAYLDQSIAIDPSLLLLATTNDTHAGGSSIALSLAQARCNCHINGTQFVADLAQVGDGFGLSVRGFS